MTEAILCFDSVTRRFGSRLALDRISFELAPGRVLGLVGRNGAGKTTTLRLAQGVLHADEGRIAVLGRDPVTHGLEVRTLASLLSEEAALYPWMTVREILRFGGALHPGWDATLADQLRRRLDVPPEARVRTLSRGTRVKVALILAVACRPRLLLLDDPTAGLDPLARREVLEGVLDTVSDEGGSVVYASHLVHDIERVADELVVLDGARISWAGPLEGIKAGVRRATAVFDSEAPSPRTIPGKIEACAEGRVLTVLAHAKNGELEAALLGLGARCVEVEPLSLDEILVALLRGKAPEEIDHVGKP